MDSFYTLSEGSTSSGSSTASRAPSCLFERSSNDYKDETWQTSPSSSPRTHETSQSSYHIKDIGSFAEDLQNAADRAFPNHSQSRYRTVNVCLIRWTEDDLEVKEELDHLHDVFETLYGFNTQIWLIPSSASQIQLTSMTCNFLQQFDAEDNLFVVYYGGHGTINKSRQSQWWCKPTPGSPYVDWSSIQTLFASATSDVLVLLDCCAAASSSAGFGPGVMEAIAACGFESKAPPPGEHSFTRTLTEVLTEWADRPCFSAAMLHTEVLFILKQKRPERGRDGRKYEWCSTPIHLVYTGNPKSPGIEICSLRSNHAAKIAAPKPQTLVQSYTGYDAMNLDKTTNNPLAACDPDGRYQVPHVLISIALDENQTCLDASSCRRWLAAFPALAKYATVEAVYKSYSTLVLLSLPVMIWDLIPDNPACSFVGYVSSPNIYIKTATPQSSTTIQLEEQNNHYKNQKYAKFHGRRRSMSGDSSYESGTEEQPDHHKSFAIAAKKACLSMSIPASVLSHKSQPDEDPLFETDSESESDLAGVESNNISDWEDIVPPVDGIKVDENRYFRRVDSKRDLASSKSLLTAMLSGSLPAAPIGIASSKRQTGKGRFRSPDQKALSPRSTRRKMLSAELSVSLRQHLLWERQQQGSMLLPLPLKSELQGGKAAHMQLNKERSNSF